MGCSLVMHARNILASGAIPPQGSTGPGIDGGSPTWKRSILERAPVGPVDPAPGL